MSQCQTAKALMGPAEGSLPVPHPRDHAVYVGIFVRAYENPKHLQKQRSRRRIREEEIGGRGGRDGEPSFQVVAKPATSLALPDVGG